MRNDTWTHALARLAVRPLLGTRVTPNHLTTLRLLTGLAACICLAVGPDTLRGGLHGALFWGGLLWVLSAFLDRADGELARIGDMMSPGGHRYDTLVDDAVNGLFFLAIGIGLRHAHLLGHDLGLWTIGFGALSGVLLLACNRMSEIYETRAPGPRIWSGAWGFHPDDALYLLGPAAWFGLLLPVLLGAMLGTSVMTFLTAIKLSRLRHRMSSLDPVQG